ncbi:aldose 1-epimerase family protein [Lactobacillus sp. 3B(2020)]|uniref:aldose 1-epimerase family protein n=1 Tax=Lactobacillus sp. 3B(2020) TaxID=2695882 RepID=UPI0015DE5AAE|nr:aldose 1-epimerase family protein [Lactobacillus sp. 3B(2020)]QLL70062.1 aldose 1-epimerase family protein [Lactobacillus sp. 3B(2020)]
MIVLKNDQLQVKIAEHGAELQSISDGKREYLWQADPASWHRKAPVLFPFVGRLKDNHYTFAGQQFEQKQHGFARDMEFKVLKASQTKVTLQLKDSLATRKHYPFAFVLEVTYSLQGKRLVVDYQVKNPSAEQTLLYSLGAHPGFKIVDLQKTSLIISPAKNYGRIKLDGPFSDLVHWENQDFTRPIKLNRDLFKNDAIILATERQGVTVTLKETDNHGVQLIQPDAPFVAIWSSYPAQGDFVCLESWWGIADSLTSTGNLENKAEIMRLAPGLDRHHRYEVEVF